MKSKHTPGKWYYKEMKPRESFPYFGIHADPIASSLGIDNNIAKVYKIPSIQEAEANARLIAAAPELLQALEDLLLAYIDVAFAGIDSDKQAKEAVKVSCCYYASEAIQKARGR